MKKKPDPLIDVLFLIHLPPPIYGATIANEYIFKSHLINSNLKTQYLNIATNDILKNTAKFRFLKVFRFLKIFLKLSKILLSSKVKISFLSLTASGPAFYKDFILVLLLKLFKINIIYFFHNKGVANSKSSINNYLYTVAFKNTKSILLSKYLYQDIEKFVSIDNVYYCPYGIPFSHLGSDLNNSLESNICQLLFLGNMMKEKGVLVLLEACSLLVNEGIKFKCHFVGGWIDLTALEVDNYILDYGLSDYVVVHGPKYGEDKFLFLKNSEVFVFPTYYHYEAFPIVLLEAMQFGLPIISTNEGGISDQVINNVNGFVVPQKNAKILADKMQILIENPSLRKKMGLASKEYFNSKFTLDHLEERILSILNQEIS